MKALPLILLLLLLPASALAQAGAAAPADAAVAASREMYQQVKGYLIRAAEQMPEGEYGFQPTPQVRSYGQLIGHVANAQFAICTAVLGGENPSRENIEQARTTRAALVEALRASFAHCDRAYQITDAAAMQRVTLFGQSRTRLAALVLNAAHDFEHYGNLTTYLRLRGMVPPSSQPAQ